MTTVSESPASQNGLKRKHSDNERETIDDHVHDVDGDSSSQTSADCPANENHKISRKLKKRLKKGKGNVYPEMLLDEAGLQKGPIHVKDVRDLVLWILADGMNPPWMLVKNRTSIQHVLVLMVPGLEISDFSLEISRVFDKISSETKIALPLATESSVLSHIHRVFRHIVRTTAPGDKTRMHSPVPALLQVPLSKDEKQAKKEASKKVSLSMNGISGAHQYIMGAAEMSENDYPLPSYFANAKILPDLWLETAEGTGIPDKVWGMDCEMCQTSEGPQLARVTIVSADGHLIYDELIKPSLPITDYLTTWSGITAERIATATTTFEEAQKKVHSLVKYDVILVGHSLECDLKILKISHPHVIDTTNIYQHTKGPPYKPSLKWLAQKWLKRQIQNTQQGHDSLEDAKACLDLLALKLQKGPDFGTFNTETESLFIRLSRQQTPLRSAVIDWGNPESWHGQHASTCVACKTDEDVVNGIQENIHSHDFVFARFREFDRSCGWSMSQRNDMDIAKSEEPVDRVEALKLLDERFGVLWDSLPQATVVIVLSGTGNPIKMASLNVKRNNYNKLFKTVKLSEIPEEEKWTDEDQKALEDAVRVARSGWSAFRVK